MGSSVELTSGTGASFGAYLAQPQSDAIGAVVVLQEIFGVNASMRAAADWLAEAGFAALVPDLFWRMEPGVDLDPGKDLDRERATALMKAVDAQLAMDDVGVAADYLRSLPGHLRVAAVGFCFGGKLAFLSSMRPDIDAAVSYYGVAIQGSLNLVGSIRAPLLLHIAMEDHLCPPEAQQAIRAAVAPKAELVKIMDHPGVGHAFARRGAASLDPASADRADEETIRFLKEKLA